MSMLTNKMLGNKEIGAHMTELKDSNTGKRIKFYKAISGVIPGGSFITEIGIGKISNQRLDRVVDFIEKLESRLRSFLAQL